MVTVVPVEHETQSDRHSDFDPLDFDAETSDPGSAWERVPESSMYRCVKCCAEEG